MFTKGFGSYVCDGDTITCEVDGFDVTATIHHDNTGDAPWESCDGHGPVSDWTSRNKRAGEMVLHSDHGSHRYYDFAKAVKIAKRDEWDAPPYRTGTKAQQAERAARRDFEALQAWCNDEWWNVGVAVTVSKDDIQLTGDYDFALWGVECNYPGSDNAYLMEVANEYVGEAVEAARAAIAKLVGVGA